MKHGTRDVLACDEVCQAVSAEQQSTVLGHLILVQVRFDLPQREPSAQALGDRRRSDANEPVSSINVVCGELDKPLVHGLEDGTVADVDNGQAIAMKKNGCCS